MAKGLIALGLALTLLGMLLGLFPRAFGWFGKLPGDIRTATVFVPLTSMLLVSAVLTLAVNLFAWLFRSR